LKDGMARLMRRILNGAETGNSKVVSYETEYELSQADWASQMPCLPLPFDTSLWRL
jgi:hypothetical protein